MFEKLFTLNRMTLIAVLVAFGSAISSVTLPPVMAAPDNTVDWPCCGGTTEQVSIEQGQTAKLEVKNPSEKALRVRLQFVDKEGKVVVQRDTTVKPGATGTLTYSLSFNGARDVRAQFGTQVKTSIGLLRPALRILDTNGKNVRVIGPEAFTGITFGGSLRADAPPPTNAPPM